MGHEGAGAWPCAPTILGRGRSPVGWSLFSCQGFQGDGWSLLGVGECSAFGVESQ